MNCKICNKPIVLVPSAKDRAMRYGGKPSDYTKLFTVHSQCQLDARKASTKSLLERIK